jgi:hypothetical protein
MVPFTGGVAPRFSFKKNHLGRFIINTKPFIIKDLHSSFVQFLVQHLDMAKLTTYPKFSLRALVDFELQQI